MGDEVDYRKLHVLFFLLNAGICERAAAVLPAGSTAAISCVSVYSSVSAFCGAQDDVVTLLIDHRRPVLFNILVYGVAVHRYLVLPQLTLTLMLILEVKPRKMSRITSGVSLWTKPTFSKLSVQALPLAPMARFPQMVILFALACSRCIASLRSGVHGRKVLAMQASRA